MAQDPSWEEEVVHALRKRLQSESKTLARRLSAISLPSADEARSTPVPNVLHPQKHQSSQVHPHHQLPKRPRTTSSPKQPHPTRIPKARQMSAGTRQPQSLNSPKNNQLSTPPASSTRSTFDFPRSHTRGLGLLHESPPFPIHSASSSSSAAGAGLYTHPPQRYGLGLSNTNAEPPPEDDPPRASFDSEERPYEHWYRGEVSRNGGVGELKVGRRQEMLDIANYGHLIRSRKAAANPGVNGIGVAAVPGSRENGYLDLLQLRRKRPRAGSIGGLTRKERDSLYLEDTDDPGGGWRGAAIAGIWSERVLDQDPPTDFDKDDYDEEEEEEETEEGGEENEEPTPSTRPEDESHNVTHSLDHNHQEEQEEDDDFVLVNHNPPQPTSDTQPYAYAYAYIPTEADVANSYPESMSPNLNTNTDTNANISPAEKWTSTAGAHQSQKTHTQPPSTSATPTPRPSSRQTQTSPSLPPSRIPHPSSTSRRSSDSRSTYNSSSTAAPAARTTTPTQIPPRPSRSKSEPPTSAGASTPSTSQAVPPSSFTKRSASPGSTSASSSPSPPPPPGTTKKTANTAVSSRTKANSKVKTKPKSKSKAKAPPVAKREKDDKRSSVAMYPAVEGGEELADAIPSYMQPVTREGNWDDVVLPVVARKKGLEGYFENTNPHIQQKKRQANGKAEELIAPAPGTFGYDHSKYRPRLVGDDEEGGDEFVELDEFGVTKLAPPLLEAEAEEESPVKRREEVVLGPKLNAVTSPIQIGKQMQVQKRDEKERRRDEARDQEDAGCCKCVVM